MKILKSIIITTFILTSLHSFGQSSVKIPTFDDKYSEYVKKLETGQTDIDYQDFRFSFTESEQLKLRRKNHQNLTVLKRKCMYR